MTQSLMDDLHIADELDALVGRIRGYSMAVEGALSAIGNRKESNALQMLGDDVIAYAETLTRTHERNRQKNLAAVKAQAA